MGTNCIRRNWRQPHDNGRRRRRGDGKVTNDASGEREKAKRNGGEEHTHEPLSINRVETSRHANGATTRSIMCATMLVQRRAVEIELPDRNPLRIRTQPADARIEVL